MSYPETMDQSRVESEIDRIEGETHEQYLDRLYSTRYDNAISGKLSRADFIALSKGERRRLEDLVDHDGLTGLLNQTGFADALVTHLDSIHNNDIPAYLAFLDGDKLKVFNDTRGHQSGDQLIQTYATTIQQQLFKRPDITFLVGRLGGDEFAYLIMGASQQEAQELAQEIKNQLPEAVKASFNDQSLEQTISIGLTRVQPEDTAQTLLNRADQALHQAKEIRNHMVAK